MQAGIEVHSGPWLAEDVTEGNLIAPHNGCSAAFSALRCAGSVRTRERGQMVQHRQVHEAWRLDALLLQS